MDYIFTQVALATGRSQLNAICLKDENLQKVRVLNTPESDEILFKSVIEQKGFVELFLC